MPHDQTLLLTGAAGRIGRMLRPRLERPGRALRLLDTVDPGPGEPPDGADTVVASVTDRDALAGAVRGVDAVVHLAGISGEAPWDDILDSNVGGTHCVLEAARAAGVSRVILASSNHAAGFHPRQRDLPAAAAPRPDTYYGWSKAAGEALARLYADRFGMDVACLRIGTCRERPPDVRSLATWLSPDDAARLVEACLSAQRPGFRIVWGISRNTRRWWSLAEGKELGYEPADDAEAWAGEIDDRDPGDATRTLLGGSYCSAPLGEWMEG
jgi:uronate dehydrogenase